MAQFPHLLATCTRHRLTEVVTRPPTTACVVCVRRLAERFYERALHREVVQKEVRRRRAGGEGGEGACTGTRAEVWLRAAHVTTIKALEEAKGEGADPGRATRRKDVLQHHWTQTHTNTAPWPLG